MRSSVPVALLLVGALSACGGSMPPGGGAAAPAATVPAGQAGDGVGNGDGDAATSDCRSGMICVDALAPQLAVVPLPSSADEFGAPFGPENNPRGTIAQSVFFLADPAEVIAYYESELPSAGFEITREEGDDASRAFLVETPDGSSGYLSIRGAVDPHGAQMSIEICVEDSCVFG